MRRFVDVLSLVIVLAAALFAARLLVGRGQSDSRVDAGSVGIPSEVLKAASTGHRIGVTDASVEILVFWDYGCSFCRQFAAPLDRIVQRYPEHVAVVLKQFVPLRRGPVLRIALAAECAAEQDEFASFHAAAVRLFPEGTWRDVADEVSGLDRPGFETCVLEAALAANVERDYQEGLALGVRTTPTFFVNGVMYRGAVGSQLLDSLVAVSFPSRPMTVNDIR